MNKNYQQIGFVIVAVVCLVAAFKFFARNYKKGPVKVDSGFRLIMGTFGHVVAIAPDSATAQKSIDAAFEQFELVKKSMNDYDPNSELSRLNKQAHNHPVKVSKPLFEVLEKSLAFNRISEGAFDVTVGPFVDLMRSANRNQVVPTQEQIARARLKVGSEKIELNEQNQTVKFAVDGMRLDLGGIAKGYAIDKAVGAMRSAGATGAMVDIGGDIRCFGTPPKGKDSWQIGVQDPQQTETGIKGQALLVLKVANAAVATSGDYMRFALIKGKKYSHIIDARTGQSTDNLTSVTIITQNAIDADALATAVSIMGLQKGLELIESLPQTEAILIPVGPTQQLVTSSGAQQYISKVNEQKPTEAKTSTPKQNSQADYKHKKYIIARALEPVELSGDWTSRTWANVEHLDIDQYWGNKSEHMPKTQAKLLYDDRFIYVIFRVEDKYLRAVAKKHQDMVCFDSCVEFFFTPGQDISRGYFNLETNCGGTMLFNHQLFRGINLAVVRDSELEKIKIFHSEPKNIDPEKQQPTTWIVEYRLPLDLLEKYSPIVKPQPGVTWRANFYKCADKTSRPHLLVWSIAGIRSPDFHRPEFFGTLEFK